MNIAKSLNKTKPVCKNLGINADTKLSYHSHIDYVKLRLGKQSGIVFELRYCVPREQLREKFSE